MALLARRRIRRRAGSSAAREYERLKAEWQARNRKLFAAIAGVAAVIVVATFVLSWRHAWSWIGGFASGAALTFYIALRESPPAWIENYLIGSVGEERTAKKLEPLLQRGWVIVHDMNRIKSNLDHVLIGPGGVFVLDTKNSPGSADADGDQLRNTRPDGKRSYDSNKLAAQARAQGVELNQVLRQRCDLSLWVSAVIVVWADFPQRAVEGRSMVYVHGDHVVDWLLARPAKLNAVQIDQIAAALQPGQRRRTSHPEPSPIAP